MAFTKDRRALKLLAVESTGRKHPAHGVHFDLGKTTIVFLTICTKDRKPWLACSVHGSDEASPSHQHDTLTRGLDMAVEFAVSRKAL